MKISVLMTVYNGGAYLKSAMDSVLAQTFKDFEFLIVNDASKDNSLDIIHSYQDARIRVITNPQNIGQTASLNVGLLAAKGEYIARMDADDLAKPQWLKLLLEVMDRNPTYAVLSPLAEAINSEGKYSRVLNTPRCKEDITLKSLIASPINHVGSLMRRSVILEVGKYDESYRIVADYDLWSRLLRQGHHLEVYPQVLVSVRFHQNSSTILEMGNKVVPEMIRVMRDNIHHWRNSSLEEMQLLLLWRLVYTPEVLSNEEYHQGLGMLERMYGSAPFVKKQKRIIFFKRVLGTIKRIFRKGPYGK